MSPLVISALISAAASVGSSMLSNQSPKETKIQKQQRRLIDQLIDGLGGQGDFANLFETDPEAFKKSFEDPAMAQFQNRTAPGIQQQFIASGLQRGTGLDDSLTRAGVDMQSMLNSEYMKFLQGGLDRKQNMLSGILNQGAGVAPGLSTGEAAMQGASGYLTGDSFANSLDKILEQYNKPGAQPQAEPNRPGYAG